MKILHLTFYFEPDLCAGSFRNTPLFKELANQLGKDDFVHVVTTQPNRYNSYLTKAESVESGKNFKIDRIKIPTHKSGLFDQAISFCVFFYSVIKIVRSEKYDIVLASSSRLFTAFLGRIIAKRNNAYLYLDIRDIFVDTLSDVFSNKRLIQIPAVSLLKIIEKYTFTNANHINLVSGGFKAYFSRYTKPTFSYYTNGIDDEFLNINTTKLRESSDVFIITYAGNIGSGQGLEKIVPQAALLLGEKYCFRVIGDGGTKNLLVDNVESMKLTNVEIINPVSRPELISYYLDSDFLFLHLNDLDAFKKVLPSKIFEYGVFNKPIIAGVSGFASEFIRENLQNYILFEPTDVNDMVSQIKAFKITDMASSDFSVKFSRKSIIKKMANTILTVSQ
jgi:hypothetical protein